MTTPLAAQYQKNALRTIGTFDDTDDMMVFAALEIAAESGEVCNLVYKLLYQGHPRDDEKFRLEIGDVMWGVAVMHKALGLTLQMPTKSEWRAGNVSLPFRRRLSRQSLKLSRWAGVLSNHVDTRVSRGQSWDNTDDIRMAVRVVFKMLCSIADCLGMNPYDVMDANIAKLKRRYPEGFSSVASVARVDVETTAGVAVSPDPYLWESGT